MKSNYSVKSHLKALGKKWKIVNGKEKAKLAGKIILRPFGFRRCLFLGGYYEEDLRLQEEEDRKLLEELKKTPISSRREFAKFTEDNRWDKKTANLDETALKLKQKKGYIALVCESLDKGGLEEVVYLLAQGIKNQSLDVKVFCIQSGGYVADRLMELGVEVLIFEGNRNRLREYCQKKPPMIANTHYVGELLQVFYQLQIPVIEVIHNTYAFLDEAGWNRERIKSQYIQKYIAVSKSAKRMFLARCKEIEEDRITVIGNGTDCVREEGMSRVKTRRALGISEDAFVCIAVGSIDARKNQIGLLRGWSIFRKLIKEEAILLIVGSGIDEEYEAHVEEILMERNLQDSVIMVGQSDCVHELLYASDLFLMNSYYEGWSVAATEALCYGVPVIHSDCGSGRQLTAEGRMGILCRNPLNNLETYDNIELHEKMHMGNNDNLKEMVEAMLQMYAEKEYWSGIREDMMEYAKNKFAFDTMLAGYLNEFEKVVKEKENIY